VAEGTPEAVAANPESYTGQYLAPLLDGRHAKQPSRKRPASEAPVGRGPAVVKKAPAKKAAAKKATSRARAVKKATR
jgi:excinuclease ABC subunit A